MDRTIVAALLVLVWPTISTAQDVTADAWTQTVSEFDPANPPPDLAPNHDADARPSLNWTGGAHTGTWNPATNEYTVENVEPINISGETEIRVPNNASDELRAHEDGHAELDCYEWDGPGCLNGCRAKQKVEDAMRGFKGMKFVGEGATDAARQANAIAKANAERDRRMNRALEAIEKQMGVIGTKYDKLTENGDSDDVDSAEGIQGAKNERENTESAFAPHGTPDDSLAHAKVNAPTPIGHVPSTDELAFAGQLVVTHALNTNDTIIGRGQLYIAPMTIIGPRTDGSVHLSDSRLQIIDMPTSRVLMDALLYRVEYRPGGPNGAAGTIRAAIDIPPPFAAGITNLIGSSFLNDMQLASAQGVPNAIWCLAAAPLFDSNGDPTAGGGVPVTVTIGIPEIQGSIPAASTWSLLATALAILMASTIIHNRRAIKTKSA